MKNKVQILANNDGYELQKQINQFIEGKAIVDIKFQSVTTTAGINDRVLIMYEEHEEDNDG